MVGILLLYKQKGQKLSWLDNMTSLLIKMDLVGNWSMSNHHTKIVTFVGILSFHRIEYMALSSPQLTFIVLEE